MSNMIIAIGVPTRLIMYWISCSSFSPFHTTNVAHCVQPFFLFFLFLCEFGKFSKFSHLSAFPALSIPMSHISGAFILPSVWSRSSGILADIGGLGITCDMTLVVEAHQE